jgi:hypothetical protein
MANRPKKHANLSDENAPDSEPPESEDSPPVSQPAADEAPKPVVPPEERLRRAAIILAPEMDKIVRTIATAGMAKLKVGAMRREDLVHEASVAAEDEALAADDFPTDEASLEDYVKRLAWRVVKRIQRRVEEEGQIFTPLVDQEAFVVHPYFEGDERREEEREKAVRQSRRRMRAVIDRFAHTLPFQMFKAQKIDNESAASVAARYGKSVNTVRSSNRDLKVTMLKAVVAMTLVGTFVLGVRGFYDPPVAHHDPVHPAYERALALELEGQKECDLGNWDPCLKLLDEAAEADPTIEQRASYKTLHQAAVEALAPRPTPVPTATNEDREGPKGDKRRKGTDDTKAPAPKGAANGGEKGNGGSPAP